ALVMADPQVHYIEYPLPPKVRCLKCAKCFGDERVGKVKGKYSDLPYLSKHLKKYHPGDTISYRCSECNYKPKGKYPYKDVKAHFTKCHVSLAVDAAGPSTRGSFVTADPSTRSASSSTTACSKTAAKSAAPIATSKEARRFGEAIAMSKSPMTAMVSKPRVVSVEVVSLPPTTRGSPPGSPSEILISFSPATSLPTTLTTGFTDGVGRQTTPPTCLPQRNILPTIGEEITSPCVAVTSPPIGGFSTSPLIQPRPTTPEPERGQEERRQEGAAARGARGGPSTPAYEQLCAGSRRYILP
ncbi:hypothetical protein ALC57_02610, partial [Trachymyrmex cornetzi]